MNEVSLLLFSPLSLGAPPQGRLERRARPPRSDRASAKSMLEPHRPLLGATSRSPRPEQLSIPTELSSFSAVQPAPCCLSLRKVLELSQAPPFDRTCLAYWRQGGTHRGTWSLPNGEDVLECGGGRQVPDPGAWGPGPTCLPQCRLLSPTPLDTLESVLYIFLRKYNDGCLVLLFLQVLWNKNCKKIKYLKCSNQSGFFVILIYYCVPIVNMKHSYFASQGYNFYCCYI